MATGLLVMLLITTIIGLEFRYDYKHSVSQNLDGQENRSKPLSTKINYILYYMSHIECLLIVINIILERPAVIIPAGHSSLVAKFDSS